MMRCYFLWDGMGLLSNNVSFPEDGNIPGHSVHIIAFKKTIFLYSPMERLCPSVVMEVITSCISDLRDTAFLISISR